MCVLPGLLLCIMGMTPVTSGFPLRLADDSPADTHGEWAGLFPSISLRDWNVQMLTVPDFVASANSKAGLVREAWLSGPQSQLSESMVSMEKAWPATWSSAGSDKRSLLIGQDADKTSLLIGQDADFTQSREKRNLVMTDDASSGLKRNLVMADDASSGLKRNLVMADDAAFREKSKLLTAMERQKWLNSYMQKMLVGIN